jgi:serine phosphatase RsbU (regulator of sigma subunit)
MTSLVRHGAHFIAKHETSPSRILARLNEALREQPGMWLCSALCASLHPDRVVISSAGHPAPFIVRTDGRIREIGIAGPILGAWNGGASIERSVPIGADETLFLFTDGVIDTRGKSERFGNDRLRSVLREHAAAAPSKLLIGLERTLEQFGRHTQSDDTAAVALRPLATAASFAPQATRPQPDRRTLRAT